MIKYTWGVLEQCSEKIAFFCLLKMPSEFNILYTVHGVLKARTLKWFAIPFPRGPRFVKTPHHGASILVGPAWHDP